MKKVFAIILVLSIILCACSVAAQPEIEALNTEVKKPIHTEIPEPTKQKIIENLSFSDMKLCRCWSKNLNILLLLELIKGKRQ